ncbi:putative periplasmic lipoprotein [Paenibacillus alkalitolerans]|uniref:hypothetical protein n=1 Tax=Paenibacillus alkalitolerans TaxID=2799335 RepID=UPI0018F79E26|nr:hypothetical protein [Paenibacillus alkalitolerans]
MNNRTYLKVFIIGVSLTVVLLSGCGSVQTDSYESNMDQESKTQAVNISLTEDTMTGLLLHIDTNKRELRLNISNWVNRGKTEVNDMMHSKIITYHENTIFQDEYGSIVHPENFKIGEKMAVLPTPDAASSSDETAFTADKIIQLTMSKEEKLDGFLAEGDNFHTVVLYEEGTTPPYDEMDFDKHVPESFSGGISWVPSDGNR